MTGVEAEQYLIFSLASRLYASKLAEVKRVIYIEKIYNSPLKRDHFRGLVDFEGGAVPLYNIKSALGLDVSKKINESLVAVLTFKDECVGILIDSVFKVTSIDSNYFEEFDSQLRGVSKKVLWEGNEIILIDGAKLLLDVS